MIKSFWTWYEEHYKLNLILATGLFLLQLFHLYWMTTHVVFVEVFGWVDHFAFPLRYSWIYALVDYSEIPALISVSLVYINDIRRGKKTNNFKNWLYLFFLNIQFVHLFWITDEVVVANFTGSAPIFIPRILAYGAIAIDFLELPVMVETGWKALKVVVDSLKTKQV